MRMPRYFVALVVLLGAAACVSSGSRAGDDIEMNGRMTVRASSSVEQLLSTCASEVNRDLKIASAQGSILARPTLEAGGWQKDPDVAGALICELRFSAVVPRQARYYITVGTSPPLVFATKDVVGKTLAFLDPSQFFDPGSYAHPQTTTTGR